MTTPRTLIEVFSLWLILSSFYLTGRHTKRIMCREISVNIRTDFVAALHALGLKAAY